MKIALQEILSKCDGLSKDDLIVLRDGIQSKLKHKALDESMGFNVGDDVLVLIKAREFKARITKVPSSGVNFCVFIYDRHYGWSSNRGYRVSPVLLSPLPPEMKEAAKAEAKDYEPLIKAMSIPLRRRRGSLADRM